ncbi:hypothetical protein CVT26_012776 [Gymnopilus dilepis]|uniref:Uncharacterized protein n=1 Tax=Gymnopilus dilepis TaxID=231916 RepID=A0A409Y424_9AGAR|nr:hypothetical protein CVT26_012776 [Gymnopilus dilepis]
MLDSCIGEGGRLDGRDVVYDHDLWRGRGGSGGGGGRREGEGLRDPTKTPIPKLACQRKRAEAPPSLPRRTAQHPPAFRFSSHARPPSAPANAER